MNNKQKQKNIFYVYVYLDPRKPGKYTYGSYSFDYEPFYVGKGYEHRWKRHIEDYILKNDKNRLKINKIKKIIRITNDIPIIIKYSENLLEEDSFLLEEDIIKTIGRIDLKTGCLTNLTNGGEGNSGLVMSEETKQKIRESHLGTHFSKEVKKKLSDIHKNRWKENGDELRVCWKKWVKENWTYEFRKERSEKYKGENNPNWNNRWNNKQRKKSSIRQKNKGSWLGDNNPSRKNPPKGNKNGNNKYIYTLLDKNYNVLMTSYSITDIADRYNVNPLGLKKSNVLGSLYKGIYRIKRKKYKNNG